MRVSDSVRIGMRPGGKPMKPGLSYACELTRTHFFSQNHRVDEVCSTCGRTAQQCCDIGPNQRLEGFRHTSRRNRPITIRHALTSIFKSTIEVRPPCLVVEAGSLTLGQCHIEVAPGASTAPLILLTGDNVSVNGNGNYLYGGETGVMQESSRLSIERRSGIAN